MFGPYLLPLGGVMGHGWQWTLLWCLLICPVVPQLLGVVFVSYWPPLNPRKFQFWAYIPGNPFLAVFIAAMSTTYSREGFGIADWLNWTCLIGAAVAYGTLTWMDTKSYEKDQMITANKVHHNLLYFWYGYLAVASYIGMWNADVDLATKLWITVPGLAWVSCLIIDTFFTSEEKLKIKTTFAHAKRNVPLWRNGWRLRRRTVNGYE